MRRFLLLVFTLSLSINVYGHKPLDTSKSATRDNPILIKNHKISCVAYNKLTTEDDVDYYKLSSVKKGELIYASILVPRIDRLDTYEPVIGIIGPDLNVDWNGLNKEKIEGLLEIDDNEGVIIKKNDKKEKVFFEPFTQTSYWEKQEIDVLAPVDGVYYIAVFSIQNIADKYVLSVGKKEDWGIKDLVKMPGIWWNVRMFTERKFSSYLIVGILILIFLYIIYYILKRYKT